MPLASGTRFAGYTILQLLGTGGMGEVYLAQHPRLPRRDALKILPPEWSADPDFRSRFSREADLASTLWHPNIVGVHDRGESDGQLWISMDFIDGLDLGHLLAQRYPTGMPPQQVVAIVAAVADALDYAHRQGLLHRDVKPANIMLTNADEGAQRVVLTDFGIARNLDDISGLTATNMTLGTVAYCAPEQLMGKALDGRADQYALAATAYQLLTGTQLFPFSNPAVVISHHLGSAPPPLADTRVDLAGFDPALRRALAKNPGDRYASCTEFARALAGESADPAPLSASAPTRVAPAFRPADASGKHSATPRSRTRLVTGVVAAALLLIAGVVLLWRPWPSPEAAPDTLTSPSSAPLPTPTTTNASTPPPAPPPPPPPSDAPTSTTTTTAATTTAVVTGATLGLACADHDRIAVDPATGQEIVCLERFGPSYGWFWREAGSTEGIHERNTSCVGQRAWSSSRTPDGYMITCQPADIISSDPVAGPGSQWRSPANI